VLISKGSERRRRGASEVAMMAVAIAAAVLAIMAFYPRLPKIFLHHQLPLHLW